MKKIIISILLLATISTVTYAQVLTNESSDTIPSLHQKYEKAFKELQSENKLPENLFNLTARPNLYNADIKKDTLNFGPRNLNFSHLKHYTSPPVKWAYDAKTPYTYAQSQTGSFSYMYDYSYSDELKLADNLSIVSNSNRNTIPTIGSMVITNPQLTYTPADWLQISGGAYGAKYNLSGHSFNDIGYNGTLKIVPHDRIRFKVFGQYSVYGESNMHKMADTSIKTQTYMNMGGPMMHTNPQRYYGGSVEFKITEKFGVEAGVIRELNPFNGKWENRRFIAPVFFGK